MIDEPWKLEELEPGEDLDRRVRRRMRSSAKGRALAKTVGRLEKPGRPRGAAPFFPFERAAYVLLVAVYAIYAGARAVQVFQEPRAARATISASA